MTFKSYAQNFEDVVLWRALQDVEQGRYVDVGAQHPIVDSVSKAFYERGWRGIHVEPAPEYAEMLRTDRPDETVLQLALSDREGPLELHLISGTGLSTAVSKYAEAHAMNHGFSHETIEVQALPMKDALASLAGQDVHWLKIDVEGMEEQVLRGWDSTRLRPWIVLVEATAPLSREATYASWEPMLLAAGYVFAYFDGLNRFYIAQEHADRIDALTVPPNVLDDVELSGLSGPWCRALNTRLLSAEREYQDAKSRLSDLHERLAKAEARAKRSASRLAALERAAEAARNRAIQAEQRATSTSQHLQAVLGSTSWRVTAPLRWAGRPFRRIVSAIREQRIRSALQRRLVLLAQRSATLINRHAWLKRVALFGLRLAPGLRTRLRKRLAPIDTSFTGHESRALTPSATVIFQQLDSLIPIDRRKRPT